MKKNDNKPDNNRRKFLQGVASTGAAAVALMPVTVNASVEQHDVDKKKQGYRLTEHILDYYKSAAS